MHRITAPPRSFGRRAHQRGIALFVGLIFLVILSLVAVIAMQGTMLEMRMVTNVARHEQAFETSESLRTVPLGTVLDENLGNRGWPMGTLGGDVPDNYFTANMGLSGTMFGRLQLEHRDNASVPDMLNSSLRAGESRYDPSTWLTDVTIDLPDTNTASENVSSQVAIIPDGSVVNEGAGAAQASGYLGAGSGLANGGSSLYFEVRSNATAPTNARAATTSQYRYVVKPTT